MAEKVLSQGGSEYGEPNFEHGMDYSAHTIPLALGNELVDLFFK